MKKLSLLFMLFLGLTILAGCGDKEQNVVVDYDYELLSGESFVIESHLLASSEYTIGNLRCYKNDIDEDGYTQKYWEIVNYDNEVTFICHDKYIKTYSTYTYEDDDVYEQNPIEVYREYYKHHSKTIITLPKGSFSITDSDSEEPILDRTETETIE